MTAAGERGGHARLIGANTYSYTWTMKAADCVAHLCECGYREFEVMLISPHLELDEFGADDRTAFSARLARAGLTVRSLNMPSLDHNMASPTRRMRDYSVRLFLDAIDIAADLGATYLVVVPGRMSPLFPPSLEQRTVWMKESIDILLAHALRRGVTLALENVPFAAFPDAGSLMQFVRSYDSAALRVCYDVANAHFIGESPAAGLRALGDLVGLVHLSDTTRQVWRHDEIGLGDVPFEEVGGALDDIGYAGTCMLEIVSPDPDNALRRSCQSLVRRGFAPTLEQH